MTAVLEIAIRRAERDGATNEVKLLKPLRDRLLASRPAPMPAAPKAMLEAYGFASRPGPRVRTANLVLETVAEALKGPNLLTITYAGSSRPDGAERTIEPYGMLLGTLRYLVAKVKGGNGRLQHFRLDRITAARLEASFFARDPDFNLEAHPARAFGSYHAEEEFTSVIWRFAPKAAGVARDFIFHPLQEVTDEADGSLTVCFQASGHLEMAWNLYQWGSAVEVIAPQALREMVEAHRREDFAAMP